MGTPANTVSEDGHNPTLIITGHYLPRVCVIEREV